MFEDDNRRLVQVASIANAIARASNAAPWSALKWLAEQAKAGALPARLYLPERTAKETCHSAASDESLKVWRALAKDAEARRLERNPMPAAASTWCVHVNDLLQFIDAAEMPEAVLTKLCELAQRYRGPTSVNPTPVTLADLPTSAPATVAEKPTDRWRRRLARFRELGGDMRKAGDGWQLSGRQGALADLVREEGAAGRPKAKRQDVTRELHEAMAEQMQS